MLFDINSGGSYSREEQGLRKPSDMGRLTLLIATLMIGACTQGVPPLNFSVPNVSASTRKVAAEVRSITVTLARPDEQETVFAPGQETLTPLWKTGLEEALNSAAVFQDDAPTKVSISVKVLKMDVPPIGISFTVTTAAQYQIIDRASGNILSSERIQTQGVTPSDFAFMGLARAREAVNRAVQANIARFVQSVPSLRLPMVGSPTLLPASTNAS